MVSRCGGTDAESGQDSSADEVIAHPGFYDGRPRFESKTLNERGSSLFFGSTIRDETP
jgi:hypothetical protein